MKSRRSLPILIVVLLFTSLLLVACERPLQNTSTDTGADDAYPADTGDAAPGDTTGDTAGEPADDAAAGDAGDTTDGTAAEGGATDAAAGEEEEPPADAAGEAAGEEGEPPAGDAGEAAGEPTDDAAAGEGTGDEEAAETGDEEAAETGDEEVAETGDEGAAETGDEGAAETGDEGAAETGDEGAAETGDDAAGQEGIAHTVAEGETIFDIAARYGASWVIVAQYNQIADVSTLEVGDTIYIPDEEATAAIRDQLAAQLAEAGVGEGEGEETGEGTTEGGDEGAGETSGEEGTATTESGDAAAGTGGEPAASGAATETIYVVQPGDNLYRIGLMFGISWVQIAEANGIVNPNDIKAGQELKIPVDAPGPAPEFTHVVQRGDTLFKISQRYGVSWQAIARANNLRPPYTIYPGQTLIIPGNG